MVIYVIIIIIDGHAVVEENCCCWVRVLVSLELSLVRYANRTIIHSPFKLYNNKYYGYIILLGVDERSVFKLYNIFSIQPSKYKHIIIFVIGI